MTERKELIKPENYNTLKHGDAVEVVTRAIFDKACNGGFETTDNCYADCTNTTVELYRILPAATKLEVGELVCDLSKHNHYKVVALDRRNNAKGFAIQHIGIHVDSNIPTTIFTHRDTRQVDLIRPNDIPIDWDATFS